MQRRRTRSSSAQCTFIRRSRNICRPSSPNCSRLRRREEHTSLKIGKNGPLTCLDHAILRSRTRFCPAFCEPNFVSRISQIGYQVFWVFDPNRVSDESLGDAARCAFFLAGLDMACRGRWTDDGLNRTEVRGQMCVTQTRKERLHGTEATFDGKAQNSSETTHLLASNVMMFMGLQPRIENSIYARV